MNFNIKKIKNKSKCYSLFYEGKKSKKVSDYNIGLNGIDHNFELIRNQYVSISCICMQTLRYIFQSRQHKNADNAKVYFLEK